MLAGCCRRQDNQQQGMGSCLASWKNRVQDELKEHQMPQP